MQGVQYGVECFCGNSSPKADLALDQKKCSTPCPGDPNQSCGGYLAMDVYHTGTYASHIIIILLLLLRSQAPCPT